MDRRSTNVRATRSRTAASAAAANNISAAALGGSAVSASPTARIGGMQQTSTVSNSFLPRTSSNTNTTSNSKNNDRDKNDSSTRPRKRARLNNNEPSRNIFVGVRHSQFGKRPVKTATELPREILLTCESRLGLQSQTPSNIPVIAAELSEEARHLLAVKPEIQHYYNTLKIIKKITKKLMMESTIEYPPDSGKFRESKTINAEMFFLFGGVEVTVDLLLQPYFYNVKEKNAAAKEEKKSEEASTSIGTDTGTGTNTGTGTDTGSSTNTSASTTNTNVSTTNTSSSTSASTSNSTSANTGNTSTSTSTSNEETTITRTTTTTITPMTAEGAAPVAASSTSTSITTSASPSEPGTYHIRMVRETFTPGAANSGSRVQSLSVQSDPHKVLRHKIAYNAMDLLHYMCQNMGTDMATPLSDHDDLIVYLFTLLTEKTCFLKAATLIEDILGVRAQMFKLSDIDDLKNLVQKFEEDQLANFCRVLSITISDLDPKDDPCTLAAQDKACRNRSDTPISEVNQKTVVELPGFVQKLVKIACKPVAESDGGTDMDALFSQIDSWVTWLDSSLAFDALAEVANEDEGVYLNLPLHDLSLPLPDSLKTMHEVVYKVEVLHVLCLLLGGKQRHRVHEILAINELMPGLNSLFDKVIWRCNLRAPIHGVNENCDCSPEVALKVQFLRLLHTYCDHHDNKYLIMTRGEINDLNRISSNAGIPQLQSVKHIDRSLLCQGSKGILTKLVDVMKKEPRESPFRFWMARAIESFLRGKTSYADQTFLIRKGLLEHVVHHILSSDHHSKEVLQSYFDLLAELMKFNILAFKRFNKAIVGEEQFQKFVDLVHKNIVDSNMFVRCLALTIEHFEKEQPENYEWCLQSCRLLQFISKRENRLNFIYKLINIIHVEILTQENVSCLNTTVVFLMFADRIGELSRYLCDLRGEEQRQCRPGFLLQNFRELLFFWQEHYLHKDKDCSALEKSSCISFSKWKDMVSLLVSTNLHSPLTVAHYLHMDDLLPGSAPTQAPDLLRTN